MVGVNRTTSVDSESLPRSSAIRNSMHLRTRNTSLGIHLKLRVTGKDDDCRQPIRVNLIGKAYSYHFEFTARYPNLALHLTPIYDYADKGVQCFRFYLRLVKTYSYTIANNAIWLTTLLAIFSSIDIEWRRVTRWGRVFRKKTIAYSSFFEIIFKK